MSYQPKPARGFELYTWVFMRLSGLLLLFLAVGHMVLMHLVHTVEEVSYEFVVARFATPFWRGYDWLMLSLAMLHGVNGMRIIINDYVHRSRLRILTLRVLYGAAVLLFLVGTWVLVSFKPQVSPPPAEVQELVP